MKIDFKHENVWRPLKMNNQSLGLAFLETRNTPRQKWNLKLLKLLWEDSTKKKNKQTRLIEERRMDKSNNNGCQKWELLQISCIEDMNIGK